MAFGEAFPSVLLAARVGAEWAWTALYRDLAPPVLGYLRGTGAADPEDLTGEVFLRVVRDLARFEGGEADFRSWIFTIAHHRLLDQRRSRSRRPEDLAPADEVAGRVAGGDVEGEALERLATAEVRRVIERLSPDQRDVLLLRILSGLTVEEVARVVGKTPSAVKALQRRGVAAVRKRISREAVSR